MLDNELIRLIRAKIEGFLALSKSLDVVSHNGQKGRFRELVLTELIQPFLPPSCICLHGVTIGGGGETLETGKFKQLEDDILIVDRDIIPPFIIGLENAIVPIESVLARIEVKSKLTKNEMRKSIKNAQRYKKLLFSSSKKSYEDAATNQLLFAFQATVPKNHDDQLGRLKVICKEEECDENSPPIQGICCVEKGFWLFGETGDKKKDWYELKKELLLEKNTHNEIIAFLGLLMNSVQRTKNIRKFGEGMEKREDNPKLDRLGSYLFNPADFVPAKNP